MRQSSKKLHGFIPWQGPSEIDGKPIVLLVTRGTKPNRKTGSLVQTYILRADVSPIIARQTGADVSICGDCMHASNGTCYVNIVQGPTVVFKAFQRGAYPRISHKQAATELTGDTVRLGTYGDPAAVPFAVWANILRYTSAQTGYTHQWKTPQAKPLSLYCMASCDTQAEYQQAQQDGWRAFYVVPKGTAKVEGAFLCLASEEGGKKLTCTECLACNGTATGRTASVFIPVHGVAFKQTRFETLITIGRN